MNIIFMGTPDFAAASLKALLESEIPVKAVFTQPDKPKNRGMKLVASPVKELALEHGIPVFQPESMKDPAAEELVRSLEPDLMITAAYGQILPQGVLSVPGLGCINLHGSLLPLYRGASPVQSCILNGDTVTGVSVQYMSARMDAGAVIDSVSTPIGETESAEELFDRLTVLGAELLCKVVKGFENGPMPAEEQNESLATYCKKLDKTMSPLDFTRPARLVVKQVCGLYPWPGATMEMNGVVVKVCGAAVSDAPCGALPGKIVSAGRNGIEVACGDGKSVLITHLQPPGKKPMDAAAYLAGHKVAVDG